MTYDDTANDTEGGALVEPDDAGRGKQGVVTRWRMELELASNVERTWRERAKGVVQRYRQDGEDSDTLDSLFGQSDIARFNILWSNTEVMRPNLYNSTPRPDVRRRFRDEDPNGKAAAEVMERALSFSVDQYDFDHTMELCVSDLLLPGRAVARIRYEPTIETITPEPYEAEPFDFDPSTGAPMYAEGDYDPETGLPALIQPDPYEQMTYQEVKCEHVAWEDFRHGPGGTWDDVEWVAFRHCLTRDQLEEKFGAVGKEVPLDYDMRDRDDAQDDSDDPDLFKRGIVWEVWHKPERKVIFFAPGLKERPLREDDDPLELAGFFPIPRPMYALQTGDSLVPVELFRLYKDQADELDRVTQRIAKLIEAVKLRGIYDATVKAMDQLMDEPDNTLLPADGDTLMLMQQGGSLDRAIWMFPVDTIANVLLQLYQQREQIKQTIYEITGLSDILRGATDPNETLGAQQLKAQTGSTRLSRMQREVQRFARDLFRLKAEIMAEHFQPDVLQQMTQQEITQPVMDILRSDMMRAYRIDIETDSTIAADEQADQEALVGLLDGITRYVAAVGPVVQQGYMPPKAAVGLLQTIVRRFKLGRKIEDALDEAEEQIQQGQADQGPSPEEQQAQMEMQKMQAELQMKQAEMQLKAQEAEAEQARRQQEFEAEQRRKDMALQAELQRKQAELQAKIEMQREQAEAQAEATRKKAEQQPKREKAA